MNRKKIILFFSQRNKNACRELLLLLCCLRKGSNCFETENARQKKNVERHFQGATNSISQDHILGLLACGLTQQKSIYILLLFL